MVQAVGDGTQGSRGDECLATAYWERVRTVRRVLPSVMCLGLLAWAGPASADTNTASIAVPILGTQGKGAAYPSTITVTARGGPAHTSDDTRITLHAVTHPCPEELAVLLVHGSQKYLVMSNAGGCRALQGTDIEFIGFSADRDPGLAAGHAGVHAVVPRPPLELRRRAGVSGARAGRAVHAGPPAGGHDRQRHVGAVRDGHEGPQSRRDCRRLVAALRHDHPPSRRRRRSSPSRRWARRRPIPSRST